MDLPARRPLLLAPGGLARLFRLLRAAAAVGMAPSPLASLVKRQAPAANSGAFTLGRQERSGEAFVNLRWNPGRGHEL